MSLKKLFLKAKTASPKFLLGLVLAMIGGTLLPLHRYPGTVSNAVAWLETEGMRYSLSIGIAVLFAGLWMLSSALKELFTHRVAFTKGPLVYSIENGLLEQTIQQLWSEYFDRPDLRIHVSLHRRRINISGQTPEGWDHTDELCSFLSHKLLALTGYWGDLCLHTSPEEKH
jgi:hypothetical protein